MSGYRRVGAVMVNKRGVCDHDPGSEFVFASPYARPDGICGALHFALAPYVMACSLGGRSWETDDPDHWYISCPSKEGTVWKLSALED